MTRAHTILIMRIPPVVPDLPRKSRTPVMFSSVFVVIDWMVRWIYQIRWSYPAPEKRLTSECWFLDKKFHIMQKYEKLEKIGEGIVAIVWPLCIYGSWSIVLQYPLRGKIFYFFNSLFLTFFRYLWNRFQSETQRNARDSSTEKSKTRRRWWGEYLNIKWLEFVNNSSRGEPPATKSSEYQTTSYSVYIYELHVIVPWKQKKFQLPFAKQT